MATYLSEGSKHAEVQASPTPVTDKAEPDEAKDAGGTGGGQHPGAAARSERIASKPASKEANIRPVSYQ